MTDDLDPDSWPPDRPERLNPTPPWNVRREGRRWREEAHARYDLTPEKIEMIGGKLFWSEEDRLVMLALLLENCGADKAVRFAPPHVWREALDDWEREVASA